MTHHKQPDYYQENVEEIGRAIYKTKILPLLTRADKGKVVIIDVRSGDYEIGSEEAAFVRMLERRPNGYTWTERVGYPAVHTIGGALRPLEGWE